MHKARQKVQQELENNNETDDKKIIDINDKKVDNDIANDEKKVEKENLKDHKSNNTETLEKNYIHLEQSTEKPQKKPLNESNDELMSRSTESDSGFDSASGGGHQNIVVNTINGTRSEHNQALNLATEDDLSRDQANTGSGYMVDNAKCDKELQYKSTIARKDENCMVEERKKKLLTKEGEKSKVSSINEIDVNVWANTFLRDLNSLIAPANESSNSTPADGQQQQANSTMNNSTSSPLLLSTCASNVIQNRFGQTQAPSVIITASPSSAQCVLKPEKHVSKIL